MGTGEQVCIYGGCRAGCMNEGCGAVSLDRLENMYVGVCR